VPERWEGCQQRQGKEAERGVWLDRALSHCGDGGARGLLRNACVCTTEPAVRQLRGRDLTFHCDSVAPLFEV